MTDYPYYYVNCTEKGCGRQIFLAEVPEPNITAVWGSEPYIATCPAGHQREYQKHVEPIEIAVLGERIEGFQPHPSFLQIRARP
jgi:hypothetical protein